MLGVLGAVARALLLRFEVVVRRLVCPKVVAGRSSRNAIIRIQARLKIASPLSLIKISLTHTIPANRVQSQAPLERRPPAPSQSLSPVRRPKRAAATMWRVGHPGSKQQ